MSYDLAMVANRPSTIIIIAMKCHVNAILASVDAIISI